MRRRPNAAALADARGALRQAADQGLEFAGARRLSYLIGFVEGDAQTMERELAASVGMRATNAAFGWQAHVSAFSGRLTDAHDQYRRGIDSDCRSAPSRAIG